LAVRNGRPLIIAPETLGVALGVAADRHGRGPAPAHGAAGPQTLRSTATGTTHFTWLDSSDSPAFG
jgi:hypothetical protein